MEKKLIDKLEQQLKKAIFDYRMINDGDHILVGLSGGKDSLALIDLLGRRMRIFKPRFQVTAAHISMENIGYQADISYLRQYCDQYDIPFLHRTTSFNPETDRRKSPCFLCSWYRRKMLFAIAKEGQCNKIALGHHQDDLIQTLLLNMTHQGTVSTMPPVLKMEKFDMTIIRPLCLIREKEIRDFSLQQNYRQQKKNCPYEHSSSRPEIKEILERLEALNPHAIHQLWASMTNVQTQYLPQPIHTVKSK